MKTSDQTATAATLVPADASFLADFETLSTFGATPAGGVDRQAASAADIEMRRWFAGLLESAGLRVVYDRVGNQFGLLELVPGAPYVLAGSHLDSQPTAGRFDGAYGVLAAAHATFRLAEAWRRENVRPRFNIAVVNWFNEEGSRFTPSMMGSAVYTGRLPLGKALATRDRQGISVGEALGAAGFLGETAGPAAVYGAEIHIEQGRTLEDAGSVIGLVTASWAANKYEFIVHGDQAHTGATVMGDRRDALLGAARLVVAAREIADAFPGVVHTSVGQLDVYPNSPVVVASRVSLLLDLRSPDEEVLQQADNLLRRRISEIEASAGVRIERRHSHSWGVTPYRPEGVELARGRAELLDLPHRELMTMAGHDSINLNETVPTVMLFVPSVEGISHNERESTRDEDLLAGVALLTEVVDGLALGELDQGRLPPG